MSVDRVPPDVVPPSEAVRARHHLHVLPIPRAVGEARSFVRANAPLLVADQEAALLLLTSELVTNAVLHARTEIDVDLIVTDRYVVVAVHDLDLALPGQAPYANREGGWGLSIVGAMAESSDLWQRPGGGKTAWFRLSREHAPAVPDEAARRRDDADRRDS
ncbi:MAG: hypothetical protein QOK14_980 [Frankiaceae bacterium]|nr:hypothetical protein [Frankiaceae bacterium]